MKVQPYFLHRGTVCPCSADYGGMDAELLLRPIGNLLIKVFCGVGKRGKDQYLFVARIDRAFNLPGNQLFQRRKLLVTLRRDLFGNM